MRLGAKPQHYTHGDSWILLFGISCSIIGHQHMTDDYFAATAIFANTHCDLDLDLDISC